MDSLVYLAKFNAMHRDFRGVVAMQGAVYHMASLKHIFAQLWMLSTSGQVWTAAFRAFIQNCVLVRLQHVSLWPRARVPAEGHRFGLHDLSSWSCKEPAASNFEGQAAELRQTSTRPRTPTSRFAAPGRATRTTATDKLPQQPENSEAE